MHPLGNPHVQWENHLWNVPGISIARSGRKLRRGQHQERAQPAAFCPQFTELVGMQWTHSRGDALDQVEAMPDPCALAALHSQGLIRVQLDLQRPGSLGLDIVLSRDMPQTISTLPNLIKKTLQENLLASSLVGSPPNSVCCKSTQAARMPLGQLRKMRPTSTDRKVA